MRVLLALAALSLAAQTPSQESSRIKQRLAEVQARLAQVDQQLGGLKKRRKGVLVELQGISLQADRMRALVLTQEKLDNQRLAVKEEKRLRIDNEPYASSFEAVDALAFDCFAYRHPVIGSMEDLDAASLEDAAEFYRRKEERLGQMHSLHQ